MLTFCGSQRLLNLPQDTGYLPQQRILQPQMSIVSRLENLFLSQVEVLPLFLLLVLSAIKTRVQKFLVLLPRAITVSSLFFIPFIVVFQSNHDTSHAIRPSIIHPSIHLSVHRPSIHPFLDTRHYYRRWCKQGRK